LLCELEQSVVDNSSAGYLKRGPNLEQLA
jgi:hypothetical protein